MSCAPPGRLGAVEVAHSLPAIRNVDVLHGQVTSGDHPRPTLSGAPHPPSVQASNFEFLSHRGELPFARGGGGGRSARKPPPPLSGATWPARRSDGVETARAASARRWVSPFTVNADTTPTCSSFSMACAVCSDRLIPTPRRLNSQALDIVWFRSRPSAEFAHPL